MPSCLGSSTTSSGDIMDELSETYACPKETCKLKIGMVVPQSPYAAIEATTVRELCEKVTTASSIRISKADKDEILIENKTSILKPDIAGNPRTMEACWKAAVEHCETRRAAFKAATGKPLDKLVVENWEAALCTIAHVNNVKFLPSTHYDTVVVGGINAQRLAYAIHAAHWPVQSFEEGTCRGQVVLGCKFKNVIYFPWEEHIYGTAVNFEESTAIMLETLNQLQTLNAVRVIMLPILRKCDYSLQAEKFNTWFKEESLRVGTEEADPKELKPRLVGTKEIDSMQLIHWLQATPVRNKELGYVNEKGILTETGVSKLVDYLTAVGYSWKVVKVHGPSKQREISEAHDLLKESTKRSQSQPTARDSKRPKLVPLRDVNQLKKCYVCGSGEHLAKQCPNRARDTQNARGSQSSRDPQPSGRQKKANAGGKNQHYWGQ